MLLDFLSGYRNAVTVTLEKVEQYAKTGLSKLIPITESFSAAVAGPNSISALASPSFFIPSLPSRIASERANGSAFSSCSSATLVATKARLFTAK